LDKIRLRLAYLDELTWKHNKAGGFENHIWQVSSSDFNGIMLPLAASWKMLFPPLKKGAETESKRIGYIGVPPINADIYEFIESLDARWYIMRCRDSLQWQIRLALKILWKNTGDLPTVRYKRQT